MVVEPVEIIPPSSKRDPKKRVRRLSKKKSERNITIIVERAKANSEEYVKALQDEIASVAKDVDSNVSILEAQNKIIEMGWPESEKFAKVADLAMVHANAYGAVEVLSIVDEHVNPDDFIRIKPKEGIAWHKSRNVVSPNEYKEMSDAMKRKSFSVARIAGKRYINNAHEMLTQVLEGKLKKKEFKFRLMQLVGTDDRDFYLETVYRTNVLGAYQHGRFVQQMDEAVLDYFPFWKYMTVGDGRVRDSHVAMNGKVYKADSPVWHTWYPPNGYNCRCRVEELTASEAEADGVETELPEETPDEGFAHSPHEWLQKNYD